MKELVTCTTVSATTNEINKTMLGGCGVKKKIRKTRTPILT